MYQAIYDLLVDKIYNGVVSSGSFEAMSCTLCSTVACGLLVFLPFFILWRIIKKFL